MITADRHDRSSSGVDAPTASGLPSAHPGLSAAERLRSRIRLFADLACVAVFLGVGVAAGFPLVWGLALHQPPMAISAGCAEAMCAIALLNRVFAPGVARERLVPFLAALEERPLILLTCLALAGCSAVTLITYWPATSA
jgi:hypothetical protein